jgi:hypothetical protein
MLPPLENIASSAAVSLLCSKGVLERDTASIAPAVADNIATPLKANQSQNQRPCFTLVSFFRTELVVLDPEVDFSCVFRAGT